MLIEFKPKGDGYPARYRTALVEGWAKFPMLQGGTCALVENTFGRRFNNNWVRYRSVDVDDARNNDFTGNTALSGATWILWAYLMDRHGNCIRFTYPVSFMSMTKSSLSVRYPIGITLSEASFCGHAVSIICPFLKGIGLADC